MNECISCWMCCLCLNLYTLYVVGGWGKSISLLGVNFANISIQMQLHIALALM